MFDGTLAGYGGNDRGNELGGSTGTGASHAGARRPLIEAGAGAGVIDALTVHAGDRGHLREWTLDEIDAMEKRGQLLRTDYLDRLQHLSDTAKLNSGV